MSWEVKEIENKETWEKFLEDHEEKTFLQSWNWGEFCREMGEKIWRWGIYDNDELVSVALAEKKIAKRGTFLLVPHGPVIKPGESSRKEILKTLHGKLKITAGQEQASFIRINPIWKREEKGIALFKAAGFKQAPLQMHPEASWKLDITPPEDKLFSQMRKTTRYLIRQAQKNPAISVSQSKNLEDVKLFSRFHDQVSERQGFVPFSLEYLQKEFSAFSENNEVSLFFGYHDKEVACGSFVLFWSGIGFYHHAVSIPKFAKLSITYLLLWEAVKEAKKRGCRLFDFWGFVDPKVQPNHPWAGPTQFKMGFGGKAHEYIKTQDLALSNRYWLTYVFEKVRKLRRGL
ncbi:MAG: peptidoglycan bridge formation glycyltransferase FemA/FemB family protein [bacterium]|nr:peptidoglycan bridge formation glycyltransferase FemA/FemB family protein [bacterium]